MPVDDYLASVGIANLRTDSTNVQAADVFVCIEAARLDSRASRCAGMRQGMRGNFSSEQLRTINRYVGAHLRPRRTVLGMSQNKVPQVVGVTFHKLEKHETGRKRISASRLHDIAKTAGVAIPFFDEGLPIEARDCSSDPLGDL